MKARRHTIALLGLLSPVACREKSAPASDKGNEPAAKPVEGENSLGAWAAMMGSLTDINPTRPLPSAAAMCG